MPISAPPRICCIVEGHGEVESVPNLVHRICQARGVAAPLVSRPIRWDRDGLVKPGETERAVRMAVKYSGRAGGVFIVVDADDDCPASLGPELLQRARQAADGVPLALTLACRSTSHGFWPPRNVSAVSTAYRLTWRRRKMRIRSGAPRSGCASRPRLAQATGPA